MLEVTRTRPLLPPVVKPCVEPACRGGACSSGKAAIRTVVPSSSLFLPQQTGVSEPHRKELFRAY